MDENILGVSQLWAVSYRKREGGRATKTFANEGEARDFYGYASDADAELYATRVSWEQVD
jgi:hypothetical protein